MRHGNQQMRLEAIVRDAFICFNTAACAERQPWLQSPYYRKASPLSRSIDSR